MKALQGQGRGSGTGAGASWGERGRSEEGDSRGRTSMFIQSLLAVFMRDGGGAGPPVGLYQVVTLVCTLK